MKTVSISYAIHVNSILLLRNVVYYKKIKNDFLSLANRETLNRRETHVLANDGQSSVIYLFFFILLPLSFLLSYFLTFIFKNQNQSSKFTKTIISLNFYIETLRKTFSSRREGSFMKIS